MEISIYTSEKGKAMVSVKGSSKNTAKSVAKAYKETVEELNKKEEKI